MNLYVVDSVKNLVLENEIMSLSQQDYVLADGLEGVQEWWDTVTEAALYRTDFPRLEYSHIKRITLTDKDV